MPLDKKHRFIKYTTEPPTAVAEATSALSRIATMGNYHGSVSFSVTEKPDRVVAFITAAPHFVERYWDELARLGGWMIPATRISEIVQERPINRRNAMEPTAAAAAGVSSGNIYRRHASSTFGRGGARRRRTLKNRRRR
jgi:hypothetical protein